MTDPAAPDDRNPDDRATDDRLTREDLPVDPVQAEMRDGASGPTVPEGDPHTPAGSSAEVGAGPSAEAEQHTEPQTGGRDATEASATGGPSRDAESVPAPEAQSARDLASGTAAGSVPQPETASEDGSFSAPVAASDGGGDTLGARTPEEDSTVKDPSDWVTGDEAMTGAQRSYLDTLAREAGEELPADLTKAQASEQIERLQQVTGRGQQS